MRASSCITALALGLLLTACGAGEAGSPSSQRAPIVGGIDDPGDPAVVAFLAANYAACTGTLVGRAAVLTAGHCANLIGASDEYAVAFGADASHPDRKVRVVQQLLHPQFTAEGAPYDFAMLQLAEPVTDVAPATLGTTPLTQADVGQPIRHVGFGFNDEVNATGRGTKRTATYPVTEVDPLIVWSVGPGMQTCNGDSGGPGFMTRGGVEQLVAVVSDGPNCHDAGWDGRVDVVADWVQSTAASWEPDAGPAQADGGAPHTPTPSSGCASVDGLELLALLALGGLAGLRRFRRR